jgi:hypothetical protein
MYWHPYNCIQPSKSTVSFNVPTVSEMCSPSFQCIDVLEAERRCVVHRQFAGLTETSSQERSFSYLRRTCACSVYAECVDGAGTLEWNTKSDTFVALLDVVGTLYNAPAGDQIYVTNTDNSTAAVLRPGGEFRPYDTVKGQRSISE